MSLGAFTFVLHSHIPYVRGAGRWPFGEETLHEAMAETYLPLLSALFDLVEEGLRPQVTIGLTPILLEQIGDAEVVDNFREYLVERIELTRSDARSEPSGSPLVGLARFYEGWYEDQLRAFDERFAGDLPGAFRRLQDEEAIDVLTSACTHPYLPLLSRDSSVYGTLKTGVQSTLRHMGQAPRGIWLPECGYRPAYYEDKSVRPGVEHFLAQFQLSHFFTDTHVVRGGLKVGKAAGDAIGPYGAIPKRQLVHEPEAVPAPDRSTFRPYYVQRTDVAVFAREERTGLQVWSAAHGYPGDYLYREFHRKDPRSGLQYWRITGADIDLGYKDLYDPERALQQVGLHADHFAGLVHERIAEYHQQHRETGIIVSSYDTELFGHWWFEGVEWLKQVLRRLAKSEQVSLMTTRDYLERYPPDEVLSLPESSWGNGGGHWTWLNPWTEWAWPLIHGAERRMEELVARHPRAEDAKLELLGQVAREYVLLISSDWPFLISTGQASEYATNRLQGHLARFNHLAQIAEAGEMRPADHAFLAKIQQADNPFPDIDYTAFAAR